MKHWKKQSNSSRFGSSNVRKLKRKEKIKERKGKAERKDKGIVEKHEKESGKRIVEKHEKESEKDF